MSIALLSESIAVFGWLRTAMRVTDCYWSEAENTEDGIAKAPAAIKRTKFCGLREALPTIRG